MDADPQTHLILDELRRAKLMPDKVVAAAPRLLGFNSVGAQLWQAVAAAMARLEETGVLGREAGLLVVISGSTESPGKT